MHLPLPPEIGQDPFLLMHTGREQHITRSTCSSLNGPQGARSTLTSSLEAGLSFCHIPVTYTCPVYASIPTVSTQKALMGTCWMDEWADAGWKGE